MQRVHDTPVTRGRSDQMNWQAGCQRSKFIGKFGTWRIAASNDHRPGRKHFFTLLIILHCHALTIN